MNIPRAFQVQRSAGSVTLSVHHWLLQRAKLAMDQWYRSELFRTPV